MSSYVQFLVLLFSFIYGVFLYYMFNLNKKILIKIGLIFKFLISVLFLIDLALFYILILYRLNSGVLHIYNVICIVLGFLLITVKSRQ